MTRDEATRAAILLGLIVALVLIAAYFVPCGDGGCTVEEVRRG
jgi:hypothetical protein